MITTEFFKTDSKEQDFENIKFVLEKQIDTLIIKNKGRQSISLFFYMDDLFTTIRNFAEKINLSLGEQEVLIENVLRSYESKDSGWLVDFHTIHERRQNHTGALETMPVDIVIFRVF